MTNKLDLIRQMCIEANPDIGKVWPQTGYKVCSECKGHGMFFSEEHDASDCFTCAGFGKEPREGNVAVLRRPIRLADVLLAIGKVSITDKSLVSFLYTAYNLREDDLTKQSEETINFLYDILK